MEWRRGHYVAIANPTNLSESPSARLYRQSPIICAVESALAGKQTALVGIQSTALGGLIVTDSGEHETLRGQELLIAWPLAMLQQLEKILSIIVYFCLSGYVDAYSIKILYYHMTLYFWIIV